MAVPPAATAATPSPTDSATPSATPSPSPSPSPTPTEGPGAPPGTPHLIAYASDPDLDSLNDIDVFNLDTQKRTVLVAADKAQQYFDDGPDLSPDASQVAFSTDRGSVNDEVGIAVVSRNGGAIRRLTEPESQGNIQLLDLEPAWSPDGQSILFSRVYLNTDTGDLWPLRLYTVSVNGGPPVPVRDSEGAVSADWSPDGKRLVYLDGSDDRSFIYTVDLTGANKQYLVTGEAPAWSPDGTHIAYTRLVERDSNTARGADITDVGLISTQTFSHTDFVPPAGAARTAVDNVAWSADGNSVLFDRATYDSAGDLGPSHIFGTDLTGFRTRRQVVPGTGDEYAASASGPGRTPISSGLPSKYVATDPQRVLDTRDGTGGRQGKLGPGEQVTLPIRGATLGGQQVPEDVGAVVLNLTVTGGTAATDLRAFPSGDAVPTVSNLNAPVGATVSNLATVAVGPDGAIRIRNNSGLVHVIADIAGYYLQQSGGDGYAPVYPVRLLDTRGRSGPLTAGATRDVAVTGGFQDEWNGQQTVPADATAVVLNVTVTSVTASTDVRAYPTNPNGDVPTVSNLNARKGQTIANLVTVKVGPDGKVRLRNQSGQLQLIVDLFGYYAPSAPGRFVPTTPSRMLDTRTGTGAAPMVTTPEGEIDLVIAGTRALPANATAAVLNLTGTASTASTDVILYSRDHRGPLLTSNLNLVRGETRANLAIGKIAGGVVCLRSESGNMHLIADLAGYFI